jgi:hypothetical protein
MSLHAISSKSVSPLLPGLAVLGTGRRGAHLWGTTMDELVAVGPSTPSLDLVRIPGLPRARERRSSSSNRELRCPLCADRDLSGFGMLCQKGPNATTSVGLSTAISLRTATREGTGGNLAVKEGHAV